MSPDVLVVICKSTLSTCHSVILTNILRNPAITMVNCLYRGFPWWKWPIYACAQVSFTDVAFETVKWTDRRKGNGLLLWCSDNIRKLQVSH